MQRGRIVDAMVLTVAERGYADTTVRGVCARAKVSPSTFYEQFSGLEECFVAVLDEGHRRATPHITRAFEREEGWREGVRGALVGLLGFFDSEPAWARVLLVEVFAAGKWALEHRERRVQALRTTILELWTDQGVQEHNPLASEAVMIAVLGIIHSHLLQNKQTPLMTLLGPLMGLITTPYLPPNRVKEEVQQASTLAQNILATNPPTQDKHDQPGHRPNTRIPRMLNDPRAHRARNCLHHLAQHPGHNNRQIATAIGIRRDTHISTLLARLHNIGLITKTHPPHPGGPNAWTLTPHGHQIAQQLQSAER